MTGQQGHTEDLLLKKVLCKLPCLSIFFRLAFAVACGHSLRPIHYDRRAALSQVCGTALDS